jgi:hypothetical protein
VAYRGENTRGAGEKIRELEAKLLALSGQP